jgi:hypothetical protein
MTDHEKDEPTTPRAPLARRGRPDSRRRLAVIGTGGMAALLAGGAYFLVQTGGSQQSLQETIIMAPLGSSTSVESAPDPGSNTSGTGQSPAPAQTGSTTGPQEPSTAPTGRAQAMEAPQTRPEPKPAPTERDPGQVRREIEEAREKAAADGVRLQRPLKQDATRAGGVVNERTERTANGSIRVISARHDLSGQREMRFAGDEGKPVGKGVTCTNRMRFAEGTPATVRPTALLCWRVSKERSVVTMAVAPKGKPSAAASVAVISKEWAALG